MKTATKYEIRRSVRRSMMPRPRWNPWNTMPECTAAACRLYIAGKCAWNKQDVSEGAPCVPCITKGLERVK